MTIWGAILIYLGIGVLFSIIFTMMFRKKGDRDYNSLLPLFLITFAWPYVMFVSIRNRIPEKRKRSANTARQQNVMDFRSEEEQEIDRKAKRGESLGREVDVLVQELIAIGLRDGFLSTAVGGKFDSERRHIRARQIGETLYRLGGINLMKAVGYRITYGCPRPGASRELEYCWNGIGNWRA